ncbi:Membrane fusion component of tripartite multidrug resistance system [Photobacterium marinum]|uniref:Membrane fusion component of tripartite multidrug resistance system n=2 Tax=Photobacterium marinum TaxID=1056511 RepID=L8JD22_9GAMM|nr:HlyD family secretion protein [Photobacterium marinum]ELR65449.1 Membrane fusion component of tripartite multidrug resistance system [Photobacterium marinum]
MSDENMPNVQAEPDERIRARSAKPKRVKKDRTKKEKKQRTAQEKVKRATFFVLLICIGLFIFYVLADRYIPSTDMARVRGYVIPVTPLVSGRVVEVQVEPNQVVQPGDALIRIDPADYQLAVEEAEQGLVKAGQSVGVQTASVASAQAKLSDALANQAHIRTQASRILAMAKKGIVPKAEADKTRASLASAKAQVESAQANLEQAKTQLGAKGKNNSQMKSALLKLQKAQLDLERTVLRAPAIGGVSNFRLDEGFYARSGQPLLTFVSGEDVWIDAYFRENSLGNMIVGDEVEIVLDYAPGRVFKGKVASIDWGINWGQTEQVGQLASVSSQTGWLRQTQRFPVTIQFDDDSARGLRRVGGQADVIVYTQENSALNIFGRIWIRIVSWLSYVR